MREEDILRTAERLGFSHAGFMAAADLCFMKEVRDMCAADRCHMYGRSWMCPPACGTLEENAARASAFRRVLLVQTTARLEDAFDIDTMTRAEAEHKDRFIRLCDALRRETRCLPLGSGACTCVLAAPIPTPPAACPRRRFPPWKASAFWSPRPVRPPGMKYYYGPGTLTYTSCVLLDEPGWPDQKRDQANPSNSKGLLRRQAIPSVK